MAAPLVLLFALFSGVFLGCAGRGVQADGGSAPLPAASLEEAWGVKDLSIRLASNGYMLDFRYRVTDPGKALPLFDRKIQPYLVDEGSGAHFYVPNPPTIGSLRTTRPPQEDRVYFIIFGNPGKYIKPGSRVTVVVGDFKAENLTVQ
jgi:hypothetical protein